MEENFYYSPSLMLSYLQKNAAFLGRGLTKITTDMIVSANGFSPSPSDVFRLTFSFRVQVEGGGDKF